MSVPTPSPTEFRLPAACVDLATHLGAQFELPSHLLLACFPLAIGVAANRCRLETSLWPEPINAAFNLAIGADSDQRLRLAIDYILAPVLDALSRNASLAVGLRPNNAEPSEQESLIICDNLRQRTPSAGAPRSEPARRRAQVVANLKPGQLARVTDQHPDCLTLAKYDGAGFAQLIEKARNRAERDLMLL